MEEGFNLSNHLIDTENNEELSGTLLNYFLKPFKDLPSYHFSHPADLELNDVYKIISGIFKSSINLVDGSRDLAKMLYEISVHPRIKSGEFYVVYFSDCIWNEEFTDAIGLFKSENRDRFLQIDHGAGDVDVQVQEGINTSRLDKGCLILDRERENGYVVFNVDNINKSNEAQYWKDDFLKLKPAQDNFHHTSNFLSVAKEFITKKLTDDFEVSRTEQINLLNKSVDYFKGNENFHARDFEEDVFQDPGMIQSFRKFGSSYLDSNDIDIAESFEISSKAVKQQARIFRNVVKLDKNFHIYIHGRADLIEKGYDASRGKNFYKIYFEEES